MSKYSGEASGSSTASRPASEPANPSASYENARPSEDDRNQHRTTYYRIDILPKPGHRGFCIHDVFQGRASRERPELGHLICE
jgi:hypothetical protein